MRVDGSSNIQAAIRTNVADLMGRLETGDVIKAKVLEITSEDVILRLFDGSVLKAAAGEELEAKVGQTLTLTVTSKTEGTLFLETLKDQSEMNSIKPDLLKNLLTSLNLKSNSRNLELAAEFIKAGISPTEGQFEKASLLMKDNTGLNAEKAVFVAYKGIESDQVKIELLSKLLDGDLKLGTQLKELQTTLNNVRRTGTNSTSNNITANAIPEATTAATTATTATKTAALAEAAALSMKAALSGKSASALNSAVAQKTDDANPSVSGTQTSQQLQTSSSAKNAEPSISNLQAKNADVAQDTVQSAGLKNTTASKEVDSGLNVLQALAAQKNAEAKTLSASITTPKSTVYVRDPQEASLLNNSLNSHTSMASGNTESESAAILNHSNADASERLANTTDRLSRTLSDNTANSPGKSNTSDIDPLLKLKDTIKDLFVRLESGKMTGETDLSKIHKELYDKLDTLGTAIHNSGLSGLSDSESVTAAVSLLDDSAKLLNQLNSNNMLYYQMPVNLSGQNTTAELYIMKRQQSKKRIDPHNSVMFVSLDTNNLGRFETLIDVKGNNVTMNFRTEKQEINDFIKENIKFLYTGLSESGYKLADIRYALIDSATPPLKLEQLLSKMMALNRSKVDMRV
jgi:hypothetical protein